MSKNTPKGLFSPELRTASIVPRWSIVRTVQDDFVAGHSFYVAIYARDVAHLLGWTGPKFELVYVALTHDLDELITGDIVSPVKKHIIDEDRAASFVDSRMRQRVPGVMDELNRISEGLNEIWLDQIDAIIRVADRFDAAVFIATELRVGNKGLEGLFTRAKKVLESSWRAITWVDKDSLSELWATVLLPAIDAHLTDGGEGL